MSNKTENQRLRLLLKEAEETLQTVSTALPVLATMCRRLGLRIGEAKGKEMQGWISETLAKIKRTASAKVCISSIGEYPLKRLWDIIRIVASEKSF